MAGFSIPGLFGQPWSDNPETDNAARQAAIATSLALMMGRGRNAGEILGQAGMQGLGMFSSAIAQQEAMRREREERALRERQMAGQEDLRRMQAEEMKFRMGQAQQGATEKAALQARLRSAYQDEAGRLRAPAQAQGPQVDPTKLPFMRDLQDSGVQTFPVPGAFDPPPPAERDQEMGRLTQTAIAGDRPVAPSPYQRFIEQHREQALADADRYESLGQYEKAFDALQRAKTTPTLKDSETYFLQDGTPVRAPAKAKDPTERDSEIRRMVAQGLPQNVAEGIADGHIKIITPHDGGYALVDLRQAAQGAQGGAPTQASAPATGPAPAVAASPAPASPYQQAPVPPGVTRLAPSSKPAERLNTDINKFSEEMTRTGVVEFEQALRDVEQELDKLYGKNIPGFGRVEGMLPNFMASEAGAALRQKVASVRNIQLRNRSGAAVTDNELQRYLEELGTKPFSSDQQLRDGIAGVRRRFEAAKSGILAGAPDEVLGEYSKRLGEIGPAIIGRRAGSAGGRARETAQYQMPDGRVLTFPSRDALLNFMFEAGLGPDPKTMREVPVRP